MVWKDGRRTMGRSKVNPKCPGCGRVLVNRLVDHCLYCETVLPIELRLPEAEKQRLRDETRHQLEEDHQMRVEAERRRPMIDMEYE